MNFQINEDTLWDYVDGLLTAEQQQLVEKSVANSIDLQILLENVKKEQQFLLSTPIESPSPTFSKNLMAAWSNEQVIMVQKKARKDYTIKIIMGIFGALLGLSLLVFVTALSRQPGLSNFSLPYLNLVANPTYTYTMLFLSMLLITFGMDKKAAYMFQRA